MVHWNIVLTIFHNDQVSQGLCKIVRITFQYMVHGTWYMVPGSQSAIYVILSVFFFLLCFFLLFFCSWLVLVCLGLSLFFSIFLVSSGFPILKLHIYNIFYYWYLPTSRGWVIAGVWGFCIQFFCGIIITQGCNLPQTNKTI